MMEKVIGTIDGIPFSTGDALLQLSYLIAAMMFVWGLKLLSHPDSARKGNMIAGSGMVLAMLTTLLLHKDASGNNISLVNIWIILAAVGVGTAIGWIVARKVKMTAMPQLVSLYNGTGGGASMIVAMLEYPNQSAGDTGPLLVTLLGLIIGAVTFSGSIIAYGKLDGKIGNIYAKYLKYVNIILLILIVGLGVYMMQTGNTPALQKLPMYVLLALSLLYGVLFVLPIGGADMPVVISLLNSFSGIAASMAGFIYHNEAMILGGILVGAAGTILTILMCNSMNRSLLNVLIGAFGGNGKAAEQVQGIMKEMTMSDAAILLAYSKNVVIIPGYGLAVAQAQHACHALDVLLSSKGVNVRYAIHPVAGRMPGHMNVLLAEADVPYDQLIEMDSINPDMPNTDVAVVIGANDVVNPAAINDPSSPIAGMPIIHAYEAKNIIVMKRGNGRGYAGIENQLFFNDKTRLLFGNAKDTLQKLESEIENL